MWECETKLQYVSYFNGTSLLVLCTHKWVICFAYGFIAYRPRTSIHSAVCAPFNFHPFFLSLASKCFSLCACNYCRIENVWKCATVSAHKKNHFKTMVFLPIRYTWGVNDSFAQNEKTLHAEAKVTCWQNQRISMKKRKKRRYEQNNTCTRNANQARH